MINFVSEEPLIVNSLNTTNRLDDLKDQTPWVTVADKILRTQEKLGKLIEFRVRTENLSDSSKRRLKDAGKMISITIPLSSIIAAIGWVAKKNKKVKKSNAAEMAGLGAMSVAGAGYLVGSRRKDQTIVIIAKYKYGTKVFNVFSLKPEYQQYDIGKVISDNVLGAARELVKKYNYAVKEDVSLNEYKELTANDYLVEEVLDSEYAQLLEDEEIATAAKEVSDFEDVEADEKEVEEDFLFEDEDCEYSDEEELDEEVIFETDMFKIK